jgi:hypothetical protein
MYAVALSYIIGTNELVRSLREKIWCGIALLFSGGFLRSGSTWFHIFTTDVLTERAQCQHPVPISLSRTSHPNNYSSTFFSFIPQSYSMMFLMVLELHCASRVSISFALKQAKLHRQMPESNPKGNRMC